MSVEYRSGFFASLAPGAEASARVVVPLVVQLLSPSSVLDVGCGTGIWLRVFSDLGAIDLCGVDGYAGATGDLVIHRDAFHTFDLAAPLDLGDRFDLVVSLEVAEHLPPERSDSFVESLCRHSDAVLFSAAIPGQGGTGHVNEQWQSHWAAMFASRGYKPFDIVRPEVWDDDRVDHWYRQNTLLYATGNAASRLETFATRTMPLDVVHPQCFAFHTRSVAARIKDSVRRVAPSVKTLGDLTQDRLARARSTLPFSRRSS
jgi:SAM-dependent methyltransferase